MATPLVVVSARLAAGGRDVGTSEGRMDLCAALTLHRQAEPPSDP